MSRYEIPCRDVLVHWLVGFIPVHCLVRILCSSCRPFTVGSVKVSFVPARIFLYHYHPLFWHHAYSGSSQTDRSLAAGLPTLTSTPVFYASFQLDHGRRRATNPGVHSGGSGHHHGDSQQPGDGECAAARAGAIRRGPGRCRHHPPPRTLHIRTQRLHQPSQPGHPGRSRRLWRGGADSIWGTV